jgi:hypothetical protein
VPLLFPLSIACRCRKRHRVLFELPPRTLQPPSRALPEPHIGVCGAERFGGAERQRARETQATTLFGARSFACGIECSDLAPLRSFFHAPQSLTASFSVRTTSGLVCRSRRTAVKARFPASTHCRAPRPSRSVGPPDKSQARAIHRFSTITAACNNPPLDLFRATPSAFTRLHVA